MHGTSADMAGPLVAAAVALATALVPPLTSAAHAQGFNVQPMMMDAAARAGQVLELPLRINSTSATGGQTVELRLVELTQTPQGNWWIVERDGEQAPPHEASAADWITLASDSLELAAVAATETTVTVRVPRAARGAYFAALLVETPRPPDAAGLIVRVRFLIPIIIQIQGRSVRQQVELDDVTMIYEVDEEDRAAPTTRAHLHIVNRGRTYSRVRGQLTVERQSGERWRPVTRINLAQRSIIPGVTLELGGDLERRLPSGIYRLRGELSVDGRRTRAVEKMIAFEGDPNVDAVAYDTALTLEPEMVQMDVAPGTTRTAAVRIENPGEDAVTVRMAAITPDDLRGVAMGELRGDAYSAEPWTEIQPAEFTIRPGGWRNVRVISRVPREDVARANYYADLLLEGRYADGQNAGVTRSIVHLARRGVEAEPRGMIERILVAEGDAPSEHVVQARFVNIGNVHLEPVGDVQVLSGRGTVARARLAADPGPVLPLGKRSFSGTLDLSQVDPGYYVLRASFGYGFQLSTADQLLMEVIEETDEAGNAVRRVAVLDEDVEIELPEGETLPTLEEPMAPQAAP